MKNLIQDAEMDHRTRIYCNLYQKINLMKNNYKGHNVFKKQKWRAHNYKDEQVV